MLNYYLYFILLLILLTASITKFRIGNLYISNGLDKLNVLIACCFVAYIFYSSVNAIDSISYKDIFSYVGTSVYLREGVLFKGIFLLVKNLSGSYEQARLVIACFYLIPIVFVTLRYRNSINTNLFLLLAMIFPLFQNAVALKNTASSLFVFFAFYVLLSDLSKRRNIIFAFLFIIIATGFHSTAIIYIMIILLLLIGKRINNPVHYAYLILLVSFIAVLVFRLGLVSNLLAALAGETNSGYIQLLSTNGLGFLIISFLHILCVLILFFMYRQYTENNGYNQFYYNLMILNFTTLIFIPFYSIIVLFFRLYRNLLLLNGIFVAELYAEDKKNILLILYLTLMIVLAIYDANGLNSIISVLGTIM